LPTYTFICDQEDGGCGNEFELFMLMCDYSSTQVCPQCHSLKHVRRNLQADQLNTSVKLSDDEIKLGHLAHRNTERLSNDEKAHLDYKHNEYKYHKRGGELPKGMKHLGFINERRED
jgi:hypothetical protein